jgi:hypothetical protein
VKVGSDANYTVRIRERGWEEPEEQRPLYAGIFTFDLNQVVSVSFVPDLTGVSRPWSVDSLPDDIEEFTEPWQARLIEALTAPYAVTPDPVRAGTEERFAWPWPVEAGEPAMPPRTVLYVTPQEFAELSVDLAGLTEVAGRVHSVVRREAVAEHEAVRFVERRILDSPLLEPGDAQSVGR